jgi:hypothetical protein
MGGGVRHGKSGVKGTQGSHGGMKVVPDVGLGEHASEMKGAMVCMLVKGRVASCCCGPKGNT